nr:hypothetical protein [Tanacetum cinerariifolium]
MRKNTQVPQPSGSTKNVVDKAVYKELDDRLVRVATTASSLEAEQDSGAKIPWGIQLLKLGLRMCLNFPMTHCSQEKTKTTQALEITSMKKRVKNLEKKQMSRTHKLKRLYKIGLTARVDSSKDEQSLGEDESKQRRKINDIDADEDITLVNDQDDAEMFDVNDLQGEEVFVEKEVVDKEVSAAGEINVASIATTVSAVTTITTEEITLAQVLVEIKTTKPKVKGIVLQEPSESTTTTKMISSKKSQDTGKGIMVEEPVKLKKKDQIRLDKETALKLQAEFDEEEQSLARENLKKVEANIALIETWDDVQAKIGANYQMAKRLKEERSLQLRERKKRGTNHQHKLNKEKIMCTYLKNVEGKKIKDLKIKDLKNKSFDSIQKIFDRAFKRVNTFVDFRMELVEGSSKRAGEELTQESVKKKKVEDDKETIKLKQLIKIIPDEEEVAIDAILFVVKSTRIVDWKIYKEGKKSCYQIIKSDGSSKMYMFIRHMLKSFDREDLYKLKMLYEGTNKDTKFWNGSYLTPVDLIVPTFAQSVRNSPPVDQKEPLFQYFMQDLLSSMQTGDGALARAKLNAYSREAGKSKDRSGPESLVSQLDSRHLRLGRPGRANGVLSYFQLGYEGGTSKGAELTKILTKT